MSRPEPRRLLCAAGLAWVLVQPAWASAIYSCTTADGRRLTSDRPIAECAAQGQRLHRKDGSVKSQLPPLLSPEQAAAAELARREELLANAALADAARYDRNLLSRYRRQADHDRARRAALDDVQAAMQVSERRLAELAQERKALDDEAEFYKGRLAPPNLRRQLDANDAARDAQRLAIASQGEERARVSRRYDVELTRLKKLWAGAMPGSLGPPPNATGVASTVPAASAAQPAASRAP